MHFSTCPEYKGNQVGQMESKQKNQWKAGTVTSVALYRSCFLFELCVYEVSWGSMPMREHKTVEGEGKQSRGIKRCLGDNPSGCLRLWLQLLLPPVLDYSSPSPPYSLFPHLFQWEAHLQMALSSGAHGAWNAISLTFVLLFPFCGDTGE